MPRYIDRYEDFRFNDKIKPIPGLFLKPQTNDKSVLYKLGETRHVTMIQH